MELKIEINFTLYVDRLSDAARAQITPVNAIFREFLEHRREGARRRGWAMGWDRDSPEQMLTPANQEDIRVAAITRQLRCILNQDREDRVGLDSQQAQVDLQRVEIVDLDDPPMDVAQALADGNGEMLSLSDVARAAQGIAGQSPTPAVVRILGRPSVASPTPDRCCLCLGPSAAVAVVGCGHLCICSACIRNKELALHHCPVCRGGLITKDRNLVLQNIF
jgi:hypothetical protein